MAGTNYFTGAPIAVALTDEAGDAMLAKGTAALLPTAVPGYAVGCEYIATDTGAHYYNTGSRLSASFAEVELV